MPTPPSATSAPNTAATSAIAADTATFAPITRARRGSWVNVVSTVRCVHSLVSVRIDTTGNRVVKAIDAKSRKLPKVWSSLCFATSGMSRTSTDATA